MSLFQGNVPVGGGIHFEPRTEDEKRAAEQAQAPEPAKRKLDWGIVFGLACVAVAAWLWWDKIVQAFGMQ